MVISIPNYAFIPYFSKKCHIWSLDTFCYGHHLLSFKISNFDWAPKSEKSTGVKFAKGFTMILELGSSQKSLRSLAFEKKLLLFSWAFGNWTGYSCIVSQVSLKTAPSECFVVTLIFKWTVIMSLNAHFTNCNAIRLFTIPYVSVRSWRSKTFCYRRPSWMNNAIYIVHITAL